MAWKFSDWWAGYKSFGTANAAASAQLPPPQLGERTEASSPLVSTTIDPRAVLAGRALEPRVQVLVDTVAQGQQAWSNNYYIPEPGTYEVYEHISLNPTIRLVRNLINGPILASSWVFEKANPDTPDEHVDLVRRNLEPQRHGFMKDALRCWEYGWWWFEKVWTIVDGEFHCRLKSRRPHAATIYRDKYGNFAGVSEGGDDKLLRPNKCFVVTHDGMAGNFYGTSRYDAAYETWVDWKNDRLQAERLKAKVSGIIPILYYPPGTTMIDGVEVDNSKVAERILERFGIARKGAAIPSLAAAAEDIRDAVEWAGKSLWKLDFYDAGSSTPAISGLVESMGHNEKLLVRSLGWPERSALEAQTGTRADAEQQTDNTVTDRENIDDDISEQLNRGPLSMGVGGVVDDILLYNFGPEAVGTVVVNGAPLVNHKRMQAERMLMALMADTAFKHELIRSLDITAMVDHSDLPKSDHPFDVDEMLTDSATETPGDAEMDGDDNPMTRRMLGLMGRRNGTPRNGDGDD